MKEETDKKINAPKNKIWGIILLSIIIYYIGWFILAGGRASLGDPFIFLFVIAYPYLGTIISITFWGLVIWTICITTFLLIKNKNEENKEKIEEQNNKMRNLQKQIDKLENKNN